MVDDSLGRFHPLSKKWFLERFGSPTRVQREAWPLIEAGKNVLVTAPTGSGKTLTAFFHALDGLLTGRLPNDGVRVLYVSPLKALNNDIRRNLIEPLAELREVFAAGGVPSPDIRVMTRSGDTPEDERRRMSARPPAILITTPESLNILLTSKRGERMLDRVETVILDEIHAVADSKRGVYLMTAVERLTLLSGEFQRIALTATVNPMGDVARFIGGYRPVGRGDTLTMQARDVEIVSPAEEKRLSVRISFVPQTASEPDDRDEGENPAWKAAAAAMASRIDANEATLIFANSRRGVERLSRLINETAPERQVFAHHGSLSKEIRLLVEERLKSGNLKGVVATSSLELGIDVGHIDEVLMLESPLSTAATLQRIGRSGHRVGETSRGVVYVLYPDDAVNAAIIAREVGCRNVEPITPPSAPLDVLAQVVLSMCAMSTWQVDDLFDQLRSTTSYHDLSRQMFDLVVDMLAGKYAGVRVDTLRPRLVFDKIDGTLSTLPSVTKLLYRSGGTIPDRGYFSVRIKETGALIGELDEEFVWERKLGDIITLGVQSWRIRDITYSDVFVTHYKATGAQMPFWRCEERGSSAYFADIRASFLETADRILHTPKLEEQLSEQHAMDKPAREMVIHYLSAEKRALGVALPHRRHVVVEKVAPKTTGKMAVTVIHTEWGGKVNRPFSVALAAALSKQADQSVQTTYDDGRVAVALETDVDPETLMGLVTADNAEGLIRSKVEETGFFGAAFRENAARALLILRAGFGRRTPLWLNRKRAKELRERTRDFKDFPITLETFRTVLQDEADLPALLEKLIELHTGRIAVSVTHTAQPSPFAESIVYKLTNVLMYDDDAAGDGSSATSDALIEEVLFSDALRPRIAAGLIDALEQKLQRRFSGYSPGAGLELLAWVKERGAIPKAEWLMLAEAVRRDHDVDIAGPLAEISDRVLFVSADGGPEGFVVAVEQWPLVSKALALRAPRLGSVESFGATCPDDLASAIDTAISTLSAPEATLEGFLSDWLRFFGPMPIDALATLVGVARHRLLEALAVLKQEEEVVVGRLSTRDVDDEVCHVVPFRMLLRSARAARRGAVAPRPIATLPLFMAEHQGLTQSESPDALEPVMEKLFGFSADAAFFEQEIFPARYGGYRLRDMDALLAESNLQWVGEGKDRIWFCLEEERELFDDRRKRSPKTATELKEIFPDEHGRYTVSDLEKRTRIPAAALRETLTRMAFKGLVTSTSLKPLRSRDLPGPSTSSRPAGRPRHARWRRAEPDMSVFYPLPALGDEVDALDEETLNRERARVVIERYGIVFKGLLEREMPLLRWGKLFRSLRLMELSDEVVGGYFFHDIPGIQFALPRWVARLQQDAEQTPVFWMNAKDPASPCGLGLDALDLPQRVAATHLVYRGVELVLVSKRSGKQLEFRRPPDDPDIERYLGFMRTLLTRDASPVSVLTIEKINGKNAASSPYRAVFERCFDTAATHRTLTVAKRYGDMR